MTHAAQTVIIGDYCKVRLGQFAKGNGQWAMGNGQWAMGKLKILERTITIFD